VKAYTTLIFLWFTGFTSVAQSVFFDIALTVNIGTHIQRSGLQFRGHLEYKQWQAYSSAKFNFSKKGLGPIKNSIGTLLSAGASFSHGNQEILNTDHDYLHLPFLLFRESFKKYSYGYSFHYYLDRHKTSQGSGSIFIKLNNVYLIGENDILGNLTGKDQYRTGSFALAYVADRIVLHSKVLMWTGQTRCKGMQRVKNNPRFDSRYGYKDHSMCNYSNLSHGIFSMGLSYRTNHWMPTLAIGRDDEKIRNTVQNKLIHDMPFIPKRWNGAKNAHIPMLDINGNPYINKNEQVLKPGSWFLQLGLNDGIFY